MRRSALQRIAVVSVLAAIGLGPARAIAADDGALPVRTALTWDGPVMTTPAGMSLYLNSNENMKAERFRWLCTDKANIESGPPELGIGVRREIGFRFMKSCAQKFPPYLAAADAKPVRDFTIVTRPDGTRQWAYRSFPLYTSVKDLKPGDRFAAAANLGGFARRGGFQLASPEMRLPSGFRFARQEEGLVIYTVDNDRPAYTPRGNRLRPASLGSAGLEFQPIAAPAIASVSGDWSIVDGGTGVKQYSFRGKPLYRAPAGITDDEILAAGWEPVVVVRLPGPPAAIGRHLTLLGDVYTDRKGMTLYTYNCTAGALGGRLGTACDDPGDGASWLVAVCGDGKECARRWRPYLAAPGAKPSGDFGIVDITYPMITNIRGTLYPADAPRVKAWAYRGKPLFT